MGRNNTGFSFVHLISDLGAPLQEQEEHAVSACLVELQTDDKENKFIRDEAVPGVAVQAADCARADMPASSSTQLWRQRTLLCGEAAGLPQETVLQAKHPCVTDRHHGTCSPQYVNVDATGWLLHLGSSR